MLLVGVFVASRRGLIVLCEELGVMPPCRHGSCLFLLGWRLSAFSFGFCGVRSVEKARGGWGQGGGLQEKNSLALLESWESLVNKWASAGLIVSVFLLESRVSESIKK